MQHNIILDTSLTGRPHHTLRGFFWNVRTLGLGWWIMCSIVNVWLGAKDMRARRFAR
jgi:hypothetical protein